MPWARAEPAFINRGVCPQEVTDAETGETVGGGADRRLSGKTTPTCQPQRPWARPKGAQRALHNHPGQAGSPGPGALSSRSASKCSEPGGGDHTAATHLCTRGTHTSGGSGSQPPGHTPGGTGDQLKTWRPQSYPALSLATDVAVQLSHPGEQAAPRLWCPEISFRVEWPPVPQLHQNHLSC